MVASLIPKRPTFVHQRDMLLAGLRSLGWVVVSGLKVPHASMGDSRLWFKTQAVYLNDLGTDSRNFSNTHSLSSDIREYKSAEELQRDVLRMRIIQRNNPWKSRIQSMSASRAPPTNPKTSFESSYRKNRTKASTTASARKALSYTSNMSAAADNRFLSIR